MWKVSYLFNGIRTDFGEDNEINCNRIFSPAGKTADEAIAQVKELITEIYNCNCLSVWNEDGALRIFEPSDNNVICEYSDFNAEKVYKLLDKDGHIYFSTIPGSLGGHRRLKIHGRLDCPFALKYIAKGNYIKHRVFFADEETAIAAGYRPCGICMKEKYMLWKQQKQTDK